MPPICSNRSVVASVCHILGFCAMFSVILYSFIASLMLPTHHIIGRLPSCMSMHDWHPLGGIHPPLPSSIRGHIISVVSFWGRCRWFDVGFFSCFCGMLLWSLDERDMPASLVFPPQLCCTKCSPHAFRNCDVILCLLYDLIVCSVCWCLAMWLDVGDDAGKLGVSTPALMWNVFLHDTET